MTAERRSRPSEPANVAWVLPDKMGGALNVVANLLRHQPPGGMPHHVVLTHNELDSDTRCGTTLGGQSHTIVGHCLPIENVYAVVRRVRDALPPGRGVLVANDFLELAMASAFDTGRTVVQIVHGDYDYYYELAARHRDVVDVFAACSAAIAARLRARLPERADDITHLPHGVDVPVSPRRAHDAGALRLMFVGRVVEPKGVFLLPAIDAALRARGVNVTWTIVGSGPDEDRLRRAWAAPGVRWAGALPHAEVLALYPDHDVLVFPSRAEGFPLAVLEAMAAGVVPVATDLAGVREMIQPGATGCLLPVDDAPGLAGAIEALAADRALLTRMSHGARDRVAADFNIHTRAAAYHDLFARYRDRRRPRPAGLHMPYGSRLDRPWIPNVAVKAVRTFVRRRQGKVTS
jgi:glycosyltransferase involved in cell wall biosynthesis